MRKVEGLWGSGSGTADRLHEVVMNIAANAIKKTAIKDFFILIVSIIPYY